VVAARIVVNRNFSGGGAASGVAGNKRVRFWREASGTGNSDLITTYNPPSARHPTSFKSTNDASLAALAG
jgi:hypothetical protein